MVLLLLVLKVVEWAVLVRDLCVQEGQCVFTFLFVCLSKRWLTSWARQELLPLLSVMVRPLCLFCVCKSRMADLKHNLSLREVR